MAKSSLGLVHIYTGNGKGKTTAALGQALRALGHGYKVIVIQFMKGRTYGELMASKKMKGFKILQFGTDDFIYKGQLKPKDINLAMKGLRFAENVLKSGKYDLVILDEVNIAADFKLLPISTIIRLIKSKPKKVELILTGRNAPKEFLKLADLITDMKEIKHPYQKGIECRKGIEW